MRWGSTRALLALCFVLVMFQEVGDEDWIRVSMLSKVSLLQELIPGWQLGVATVRLEADGEPYEGKVAVAQVILNRTKLRYTSDGTIAGTVLHPLQFSCWNSVDIRRAAICCAELTHPLTQEAYNAWHDAINGRGPLGADVVLYHNDKIGKPDWTTRSDFVTKIGGHLFYRPRRQT